MAGGISTSIRTDSLVTNEAPPVLLRGRSTGASGSDDSAVLAAFLSPASAASNLAKGLSRLLRRLFGSMIVLMRVASSPSVVMVGDLAWGFVAAAVGFWVLIWVSKERSQLWKCANTYRPATRLADGYPKLASVLFLLFRAGILLRVEMASQASRPDGWQLSEKAQADKKISTGKSRAIWNDPRMTQNSLITAQELAAALSTPSRRIAKSTIWNWYQAKAFPAEVHEGRTILFSESKVRAALAERAKHRGTPP